MFFSAAQRLRSTSALNRNKNSWLCFVPQQILANNFCPFMRALYVQSGIEMDFIFFFAFILLLWPLFGAFILLLWPLLVSFTFQYYRTKKLSIGLLTALFSVIINCIILFIIVSLQNTPIYKFLESIHSGANDFLVFFLCMIAPVGIALCFKAAPVVNDTYNK